MTESEKLLLEELNQATEFRAYLKKLKELSKTMAVAVVSADTPVGLGLSQEDIDGFYDIGFRVDFNNKFRWCYVGLIFKGNLIFEKIENKPIDQHIYVSGVPIQLKSCSFTTVINDAGVSIGDNFIKAGFRGLTFYVLSIDLKKTLNAVGFDVLTNPMQKIQIYPVRAFIHDYSEKHKEITVITYKGPSLSSLPEQIYTENEKFIKEKGIGRSEAAISGVLTEYYPSLEVRKSITNPPPSYRDIFGVRKFYDYDAPLVHCKNGIRVTPGVPDNYKRSIFIAGGCGTFGVGAADDETQAAYLQKLLNENCPEQGFAVFNYGYYLCEPGEFKDGEIETIIDFLPTRPGDIVITGGGKDVADDFFDCSEITRPYNYGEIFYDCLHHTRNGHREIAEKLFEGLKSRNFYSDVSCENTAVAENPRRDKLNLSPEEANQLKIHTDMLDEVRGLLELKPEDNIGAVVMNCNPFTNGHRYLIETAAAQVKYLFVFAVQEDKSEFSFEDRFALMQAATDDLENVFVLPGGSFIISSITFKEYFNQKSLNTMSVNPSNDVRMFGGVIAPHLFIKTRFAGEEPLDPVTRAYNRQMEAILPQYGVGFVEIPRKETDAGVISASRVRELLKTRDFEEIAKLVPPATLSYLKEKFGK
jgi:[citrate (pro-3S)-lyase] ligase